jgi:hypothetical protein
MPFNRYIPPKLDGYIEPSFCGRYAPALFTSVFQTDMAICSSEPGGNVPSVFMWFLIALENADASPRTARVAHGGNRNRRGGVVVDLRLQVGVQIGVQPPLIALWSSRPICTSRTSIRPLSFRNLGGELGLQSRQVGLRPEFDDRLWRRANPGIHVGCRRPKPCEACSWAVL